MKNNYGTLTGTITGDIEYSHTCHKEDFYFFYLAIFRKSGTQDIVPVIISERLMHFSKIAPGERLYIEGSIRTKSIQTESGKNRLIVYFFAETVFDNGGLPNYSCSNFMEIIDDINNIYLYGTICKEVVYRETPQGRQISDLLLAVNRTYGRSDYIPTIAWSRNAIYVSGLSVGDKIVITGRIQSRTYQKYKPDGTSEDRTVYEVSVYNIEGTEAHEKD